MSDYTYTSDFGAKDGKNTGDPDKVIKGADFETEFSAIQTAVNSRATKASPTFTGTATIPTASVTTLNLGGTAVTSTAAELNILDGVTADATDLNYTDITTLGTVEASKVVTADSNGDVNFPDGDKAVFGSDTDLEIFHNGTKGVIDNLTGNIEIRTKTDDSDVLIQSDDGSGNLSTYFMADGSEGEAKMFHYGTEKLATKSTGINVSGTISVDDVEITATPAEINTLDGVTSTTAELNLLDGLSAVPDYSTGTFTPTVQDATAGGNSATVGTAVGRYTKVGRMVHLTIQLVNITTSGMITGNRVYIKDLPFTAYDNGNDPAMYWMGSVFLSNVTISTDGPYVPLIIDNTDRLELIRPITSTSTTDSLRVSDLTSGSADMYISISYEAAS